jgi:hypothetical protein
VVDFGVAVGDNVGVDGVTDPSWCWWLLLDKPKLKAAVLYRLVLLEDHKLSQNYHFWPYRWHFTAPFHFIHLNSFTALHFPSTYSRFFTISRRILHINRKNLETSHKRWCTFLHPTTEGCISIH